MNQLIFNLYTIFSLRKKTKMDYYKKHCKNIKNCRNKLKYTKILYLKNMIYKIIKCKN